MIFMLAESENSHSVEKFRRAWIAELCAGNYQAALDMTHVPEHSDWNAKKLEWIIYNNGSESPVLEGEPCKVTDLKEAEDVKGAPLWTMYADNEEDLESCDVVFTLPLNGEESILNAHFEVVNLEDGLALELLDIRID